MDGSRNHTYRLKSTGEQSDLAAHRRLGLLRGSDFISGEILLLFAREPNEMYPMLVHMNWKPGQAQKTTSTPRVLGDPIDFKLVQLK